MRILVYWLAVLLTVAACNPADTHETSQASGEHLPAPQVPAAALPESAVRHFVVFSYRPEATEAQIAEVTDAFRALQDRIPGIIGFEHGVNNSPEGLNHGFTHAYTLTFEDEAARDTYLPHPEHEAFGALLGRLGVVEDVFVVDYVPRP